MKSWYRYWSGPCSRSWESDNAGVVLRPTRVVLSGAKDLLLLGACRSVAAPPVAGVAQYAVPENFSRSRRAVSGLKIRITR